MLRQIEPYNQSLKLAFECDVDESAFSKSAKGEFCHKCEKEIVDLTRHSKSEITQLLNQDSEVCVKIFEDQFDAPKASFNPVKTFAFTSLLALVTASAQDTFGQTNTPHPTEQSSINDSTAVLYNHPVQLIESEPQIDSTSTNTGTFKPKPHKQGKLYLTWKFPFLRRRHRVRGKMIRGGLSF